MIRLVVLALAAGLIQVPATPRTPITVVVGDGTSSRTPYVGVAERRTIADVTEALRGCSLARLVKMPTPETKPGEFPRVLVTVARLDNLATLTLSLNRISRREPPDFANSELKASWEQLFGAPEPKLDEAVLLTGLGRGGWQGAADEAAKKVCNWIDANYEKLRP